MAYIGEEVVKKVLDGDIKDTYDYDIIYNGIKVDVKTKERTVSGRFSSIQSSSPLELTLITYSKSKTEEFFHDKFREHQVRGEWFKYTPVIDYLKNEYEGEYCLPEELLNTMKSNVDGQWLDYISEYSDQELCDLWFKLKTNKIN